MWVVLPRDVIVSHQIDLTKSPYKRPFRGQGQKCDVLNAKTDLINAENEVIKQ